MNFQPILKMWCLVLSLMLLVNFALTGCGIAIGPQVERKTIRVRQYDSKGNPVKIGYIKEPCKVLVKYSTDSGDEFTEILDITGWDVSPPPLPIPTPKPESRGEK